MLIFAISYLFRVVYFLLVLRAVMSFIARDYSHPIFKFVYNLTEPILLPMRQVFERLGLMRSGLDFSFLVTFILLQMLEQVVLRFLLNVGL